MSTKVLFVCLGNICRSPAAEGIFTHLVEKKGLQDHFTIDSAGTSGHHLGEKADPRMRKVSSQRGVQLTSKARPFATPDDFTNFSYIVAMDNSNFNNLQDLAENNEQQKKVHRLMSFAPECEEKEVPDPYYGGEDSFTFVFDLIELACQGLLKEIIRRENIIH